MCLLFTKLYELKKKELKKKNHNKKNNKKQFIKKQFKKKPHAHTKQRKTDIVRFYIPESQIAG